MIEDLGELVFQMPDFIHEFGHNGHHGALMRTADRDEDGGYVEWTGLCSNAAFEIHEIIEEYLLYPARNWLRDRDACSIYKLDILLSFLWGFVCRFPAKDVVLYTIWEIRGCPAIKAWKKTENGYEVT